LLRSGPVRRLLRQYQREPIVRLTRRVLQEYRDRAADGQLPPDADVIAGEIERRASHEWSLAPRPVINASGVVLHTNLGRAPLSQDAVRAIEHAASYSDLEYNLESGGRGSRQDHARGLLLSLFDADAAHVATNNAAAVTLVLAALGRRKEVIVSRGHAVEIGGGFRVPAILKQSGARLIEVGTTNRTRLSDYEEAISPRTAAILHVHSSNFKIVGFTEEAPLPELAHLAHRSGLVLVDDNGSGSLLDTATFGLSHEPTPAESLQAGADVVAFSGDKLLGGPQAGIILGRADLLARIAAHPLARAMRPDKLVLAALTATLLAYVRGDALSSLPVWRSIAQSGDEVERRARAWKEMADSRGLAVEMQQGQSAVGGGSLPGETLPTTLLVLPPSVTARALREGEPAVIGRTQGARVLLDLRTVAENQERTLLDAVTRALGAVDGPKKRVLDSGTI
jgi:L-seryl-tRNA(Ser) seleniumtransferase